MIGDSDLENVIKRFNLDELLAVKIDPNYYEKHNYIPYTNDVDLKTILLRLNSRLEYIQKEVNKLNEVFYDQLNEYDNVMSTEEHQSDDTYGFYDYEQQYYNTLLDEDEQENN